MVVNMKKFRIVPDIYLCDTAEEFCKAFCIGADDLVFIGRSSWKYFDGLVSGAHVIFRNDYGSGEPTDVLVEKIYEDTKDVPYKRVIAVGGGTIIDVAKLLALKIYTPVLDLYDRKIPLERTKELVIVPTTCGTGSEVTNISILELTARHTKMGLADDALFANSAVLVPELLNGLPYQFFATSSIDALVHATESFLSPKATPFSREFSIRAAELILGGYRRIKDEGADAREKLYGDFLLASAYAGIAFGNAGTGAVHAMSYSFGAAYHVPHGEANYVLYSAVFRAYQKLNPSGDIALLRKVMSPFLDCYEDKAFDALSSLLEIILPLKPMSAYGTKEADIAVFTENTMTKQQRLMANNYVMLSAAQVEEIYRSVL